MYYAFYVRSVSEPYFQARTQEWKQSSRKYLEEEENREFRISYKEKMVTYTRQELLLV
jgi:hypothetical protein